MPALNELCSNLPPLLPVDEPGAQSRFLEGVRQFLVGMLAGGRSGKLPGILFVDDLHWADQASLDLLIYIVRRLHGQSLLVLATRRSPAGAGDSRISNLLTETIRAGYGYTLPLERLTPEAVIQLARQFPQPLPEKLCEQLYRETEGLPLMVTAYLDTIQKRGIPQPGENWELPANVRNVLRSRLPAPDEPSWQILTTAAVIGHAFDFETLRQASGRSELEIVSGLETLLAMGLVQEQGENDSPTEIRYGFTHEKILKLVYEEISLARRRLLHQRVADAIVSGLARRESGHVAARIAQHYHAAGQTSWPPNISNKPATMPASCLPIRKRWPIINPV